MPLPLLSFESAGLDFSTPNIITITEEGTYRVNVTVLGSYRENASVTVAFVVDGTPEPNMQLVYSLLADELANFSMTNYHALTIGNQLSIQMSAAVDGTFDFPAAGPGATLSVERVS